MSKAAFQKFIGQKKNSVVKEEFRQEKKKAKKDRAAFFEKLKAEQYAARQAKKFGPVAPISNPKAVDVSKPTSKTSVTPKTSADVTKPALKSGVSPKTSTAKTTNGIAEQMPLNKYLAHCGVCSRRDAVAIIQSGKIKVNNTVLIEPGYKVQNTDEVFFNGKKLSVTKNLQYILINKPKDYITTNEDPEGRKTVMQLIQHATTERVYPIGRLDRNTSGVLLLTNDGDLTQKLSHPSFEIRKVYEARLDKPLTKADFEKIISGLILEDGQVLVDSLAYADARDKSIIGLEIHSGRNRIVRRIFEHLGYDVKGLDRVMYAGLTKKNVERGKWRFLNEKEVRLLKYMNNSKKKIKAKSE